MLTIDLDVNGHYIGTADIVNISNLADVSDYKVTVRTKASIDHSRMFDDTIHQFTILGHERVQSPWALVAKVAEEAARRDNLTRI